MTKLSLIPVWRHIFENETRMIDARLMSGRFSLSVCVCVWVLTSLLSIDRSSTIRRSLCIRIDFNHSPPSPPPFPSPFLPIHTLIEREKKKKKKRLFHAPFLRLYPIVTPLCERERESPEIIAPCVCVQVEGATTTRRKSIANVRFFLSFVRSFVFLCRRRRAMLWQSTRWLRSTATWPNRGPKDRRVDAFRAKSNRDSSHRRIRIRIISNHLSRTRGAKVFLDSKWTSRFKG